MIWPDDGDEQTRARRASVRWRAVAVAVVGVVGAVYVASALVTAGPITPLSLKVVPVASKVTEPYLVQNWQLFAPDPISEERGAVARARCVDGSTTQFVDITSEHVEAVQATRLFPSRQSRVVSNSMFNLFLQDPYLARYRESVEPATADDADEPGAVAAEDPLLTVSPDEVAVRQQGERVLANFAQWSLADLCASGVQEVQLRYVLHKFPRWSQRDHWQDNGELQILESGWQRVG